MRALRDGERLKRANQDTVLPRHNHAAAQQAMTKKNSSTGGAFRAFPAWKPLRC
jgi:hypothetical protein